MLELYRYSDFKLGYVDFHKTRSYLWWLRVNIILCLSQIHFQGIKYACLTLWRESVCKIDEGLERDLF